MTREELELLLPFHANGTLEGEELAALEAALAEDSDLAAELELLRTIRSGMQADDEIRSPGEFGLARLMRDVEREAAEHGPAAAPVPANVVPISRLRIWQTAAVVMLGLGVVFNMPQTQDIPGDGERTLAGDSQQQALREAEAPLVLAEEAPVADEAASGLALSEPADEPEAIIAETPGFGLASAMPEGALADADFTVAFNPDATEAEIRELLLSNGLEIVEGPSVLGLYGLVALDPSQLENLETSLSASAIIEHAVRSEP